jgi:nicotinamide phosphoribosyltransferase
MLSSGLGHATSHRGSDTLVVIPGSRYFYDEPKYIMVDGEQVRQIPINSVNASEHSVSTTKIFTVGEKQMIIDWLLEFPTGILSIVADTFDLWKLLVEYVCDPEVKKLIMARDGKLVIRPDSGNPVDIICGTGREFDTFSIEGLIDGKRIPNKGYALNTSGAVYKNKEDGKYFKLIEVANTKDCMAIEIAVEPSRKGVVEILWDEYGGTINEQGYKVLDSHIGAIYGDSINLERQIAIYERLEKKGFACTNIVLGIGSFTYQFNTRDTFGYAVKGSWFQADGKEYDIYKDPATDDGRKKSLKGKVRVDLVDGEYEVTAGCTAEQEEGGLLQRIYEDGKFYNRTTLQEIRDRITSIV